jgi:hypothetical protein
MLENVGPGLRGELECKAVAYPRPREDLMRVRPSCKRHKGGLWLQTSMLSTHLCPERLTNYVVKMENSFLILGCLAKADECETCQ